MTTSEILQDAKKAKSVLATLDTHEKNRALHAMAAAILTSQDKILSENRRDLERACGHISDVMLDRLALNEERILSMAQGMREVTQLEDPVGQVLSRTIRPNGLLIEKVAVPLGIVAIIYESRPIVTSDAAAI